MSLTLGMCCGSCVSFFEGQNVPERNPQGLCDLCLSWASSAFSVLLFLRNVVPATSGVATLLTAWNRSQGLFGKHHNAGRTERSSVR